MIFHEEVERWRLASSFIALGYSDEAAWAMVMALTPHSKTPTDARSKG